jgi:hypothetical protein
MSNTYNLNDDTITLLDPTNTANSSIYLSDTITLPNIQPSYSINSITGYGPASYSVGANDMFTWGNIIPNQNALTVQGDANFESDIKIKGVSLSQTLEKIEERLAILKPNAELESRWEELKELGNRYRELESQLIEKEKMWDILKK